MFFLWNILLLLSKYLIVPESEEALYDSIRGVTKEIVKKNNIKRIYVTPTQVSLMYSISSGKDAVKKEANEANSQESKMVSYILFIGIICAVGYISTQNRSENAFRTLAKLLVENSVLFVCVGCIEYWFFKNVASKYNPIKETALIESVLDEIEDSTDNNF